MFIHQPALGDGISLNCVDRFLSIIILKNKAFAVIGGLGQVHFCQFIQLLHIKNISWLLLDGKLTFLNNKALKKNMAHP